MQDCGDSMWREPVLDMDLDILQARESLGPQKGPEGKGQSSKVIGESLPYEIKR